MEILAKNLKSKDQRIYVLLTCMIIEVWYKMYYLIVDLNELLNKWISASTRFIERVAKNSV